MKLLQFALFFLLFGSSSLMGQPPNYAPKNQSKFYTDSIYSENLKEYRKHNVYLPKDFDASINYPIIYATDGEADLAQSAIKMILDDLIERKIITPVIYIGSHANGSEVPNSSIQTEDGATFALHYRLFEYVETDNDQVPLPELKDRFLNHMQYFTAELIPTVESEFNQDAGRKGRIFYGTSNGAGFGTNLLNKNPDLIGTYICYSTLGSKADKGKWSADTDYPDLYLQYGDQEADAFKSEAEFLKAKYQESNSFCELKVYQGGHEEAKWHEEFKKTISEILKAK